MTAVNSDASPPAPQEISPEPTICCCDLWPRGTLTQVKLDAYKRLIDLGGIRIRRVVHHRAAGFTTVEYWSGLPHAFTLGRLRETAQLLDPGTQTIYTDITTISHPYHLNAQP